MASALGGLAQSLAGSAGALLARQVGNSEAVAGLPQALLVLGAAISALSLSALTRQRGRAVALSTGVMVAVAGCGLITFAGLSAGLVWMLLGSVLLGSGTAAVMLGRYAAADLGPEASRPRAMASVLVATTVGAVAGPNLLAPATALATGIGLPGLVGPYLVAAVVFTLAAATLAVGLGPGPALPAVPHASVPTRPAVGPQGMAGLVVLGVANLVMVSVMTMAPIQMHHAGVGLGGIGLVVSLHIAGMFAPSPLSGWLTDRIGAPRVAAWAGLVLVAASTLAALGAASSSGLAGALVLLGVGWNLGLVAGSTLLTAGVAPLDRPRREGWGDVGMSVAAAGGGASSGLIVAAGGYLALAAAGAVVAALVLPFAWRTAGDGPRGLPAAEPLR